MAEHVVFIKTSKNKVYKHFTATGSWNWIESLSKLISNYNNIVHRKIQYVHCSNSNTIKLSTTQLSRINLISFCALASLEYLNTNIIFIKIIHQVGQQKYLLFLNTNLLTYQLKHNSNDTILGYF